MADRSERPQLAAPRFCRYLPIFTTVCFLIASSFQIWLMAVFNSIELKFKRTASDGRKNDHTKF